MIKRKEMAEISDVHRHYFHCRERYLALCRRHRLNPFDLELDDIRKRVESRADKAELVRYILRLTRLERELKDELGEERLFPMMTEEIERSGYLVSRRRAG